MESTNASRVTLLQAVRAIKQAVAPRRTRILIDELLPLLSEQECDMLKEAIELERLERTYSNEQQEPTALSEVRIEIKNVPYKSVKKGTKHNPYVYVRWRDRSREDLYLGAMLAPSQGISYSYTTQADGSIEFTDKNLLKLVHKTKQTVRYIRLISIEPQLFDDVDSEVKGQALLKVEELHPEFLTPMGGPRTYYFPVCMKTQFSKKEWQVEAVDTQTPQQEAAPPRRFNMSR